MSFGARELQVFLKNVSRNAVYTSRGQWLTLSKQESILKRLEKASVFSVKEDECTDITAVEELSVFCHWEKDGTPVECLTLWPSSAKVFKQNSVISP